MKDYYNNLQLISEARRFGPTHKETMELADFWILEKQLVHKLFKVLVPRYEDYTHAVTKMYKAPRNYPGHYHARSVLELRGKIFFKHKLIGKIVIFK